MGSTNFLRGGIAALLLVQATAAWTASAPDWMRAQVDAPVPAHDDETDAVMLYSASELIVQGPGKMKRIDRHVLKILRSGGETWGTVRADYTPQNKVTAIRGWSIPAQGKDFQVKDKEIVDTAITDVDGGELISDVRRKFMRIPASVPGSIIGYEIEQEMQPYEMTDEWDVQETVPVREARYTVKLPPGWTYKTFWLNYAGPTPTETAAGQWSWVLNDLKPVKIERRMPPWRGIATRMVLSLQPPGGKGGGFQSWKDVGTWYLGLVDGRRDPSPSLHDKALQLTASAPDPLSRMRAVAGYVQRDVRYVAIELGVGGFQPHPANEVLAHGYGDCKDKVTLMSSMLKEIGIESHYVLINTQRGSQGADTPPNLSFNHAIIAIQLPASVDKSQLPAAITHKTLGAVLFFDPTDDLVPLGNLSGALQANYGMLVTPDGGELIALPQSSSALNGLERTGRFTLDAQGTLSGEVRETWSGDGAAGQRYSLRSAQQEADQIKPIESMLTHSLSEFQITKASVGNLRALEKPLVWSYELDIPRYPRPAGELLIIRPRVFGTMSSGLLETDEPRVHPIEFDAPVRNTDVFEITVPAGYVPDSLPPAVNKDLGFISYKSATTFSGNVLRYTRTLELKELSVPVAKAQSLKSFFRTIENDERNSALLKKAQ